MKTSIRLYAVGFCLGVTLPFLTGCKSGADPAALAGRKIRVVATTTMIADAVKVVGGDRVEVDGLMRAGVDPHQYQPKAADPGLMRGADVVFYHGLHLEGKMVEFFKDLASQVKTVAVAECLDPGKDLRPAPEGYEGTHDPHVWFDVTLWMKVVEHIRDQLAEMDPAHGQVYRDNTGKYLGELARLHDEVKAKAAKVPERQRKLVTAHDAFFYFGNRYGFEVYAIQGVSTGAEAKIEDLQKLSQFIVENKIPAIFVETSVNPKSIEHLKQAVNKKGFDVEIGGKLFSDSLDDPEKPAGTYVGMVRHNIDTIVRALTR